MKTIPIQLWSPVNLTQNSTLSISSLFFFLAKLHFSGGWGKELWNHGEF